MSAPSRSRSSLLATVRSALAALTGRAGRSPAPGAAWYRQLFAGSTAVQLLVDPHTGMVVDASAGAAQLYGMSRELLIGRPVASLDEAPATATWWRDPPPGAPLQRRQRGGAAAREVALHVTRVPHDAGSLLHVLVQENGDALKLLRQRDHHSAALRESLTLFRRLCDATSDMVVLFDLDGSGAVFANDACTAVLGYSRDELVGMPGEMFAALVHPDDRAALDAHHAALCRAGDGETHTVDYRVRHRDGTSRTLRSRGLVFNRDASGRPQLALAVATDETVTRETMERLLRSEQRTSLIAREAPVGIFLTDAGGGFVQVNDRLCRLLGLQEADALGTRWHQAIHLRDRTRVLAAWQAALREGRDFHLEFRLRADGREGMRWVVASAHAAPTVDGPAGWVGSLTDITLLKETERALILARDAAEQASQAKTDFVNRMSHELRTPLTAVIGFARLLHHSAHVRLTPQEQGFMERIDANARHLLGLISNVLDLAKMEAGKLQVEPEPTDVGALARETLAQLEGTVKNKRDLVLHAEVPEDMAPLQTDPARLRQILINLIGNALKFTETGGVTVAVEVDAVTRIPVRIAVRDTGIGIPPDRRASIFDVFEQGDAGSARRFGGSGLGLAISRELCTLLGATLRCDSVEGEGTTFTVDFSRAPDGSTGDAGGVEESPAVREALRRRLTPVAMASLPSASASLQADRP